MNFVAAIVALKAARLPSLPLNVRKNLSAPWTRALKNGITEFRYALATPARVKSTVTSFDASSASIAAARLPTPCFASYCFKTFLNSVIRGEDSKAPISRRKASTG